MHGFAGQVFADGGTQHGAAIATTRIGRAPRAFQLQLLPAARRVDLPERQGAAIAQLPRPVAKLVAAVGAGMKFGGVVHIASQQRQGRVAA